MKNNSKGRGKWWYTFFFKKIGGILSGPHEVDMLSLEIILWTKVSEKIMLEITEWGMENFVDGKNRYHE